MDGVQHYANSAIPAIPSALSGVVASVTGLHDFRRVAELSLRLGVPGLMTVNKADLNGEVASQLEDAARKFGIIPAAGARGLPSRRRRHPTRGCPTAADAVLTAQDRRGFSAPAVRVPRQAPVRAVAGAAKRSRGRDIPAGDALSD